jgi:hypothetical protein
MATEFGEPETARELMEREVRRLELKRSKLERERDASARAVADFDAEMASLSAYLEGLKTELNARAAASATRTFSVLVRGFGFQRVEAERYVHDAEGTLHLLVGDQEVAVFARLQWAGVRTGEANDERLYKFAQPEQSWEAYISGNTDQAQRNIGIWEEAGRNLVVKPGPFPEDADSKGV